ncbi:MAG: cupin domain-containing protein [Desulfobaccales bacterium]
MNKINLYEAGEFGEQNFKRLLVHDSPYLKILNFNFKAGQQMAVHSHDIEGQVSMMIVEGEGEFLGGPEPVPAKKGDVLVCDIAEPHGLKAKTDLRLLVTIAPPI